MTQSVDALTSNPKKIFYVVDTYTGSTWYRCRVPGLALAARGHSVRLEPALTSDDVDWCDVLVIQRLWEPAILELVEQANEAGKMTVFDIDDDYWCINPSNPAYEFWAIPGRLEGLVSVIRACQQVTVSTAPLEQVVRRFTPTTTILPNMLPPAYWPTEGKPPKTGDDLIIGWAGSPTHYEDLHDVARVLPQILDSYPAVEVWLAGINPGYFDEHPRLRYLKPVETEQYAHLLYEFDIAMAPLQGTRFNVAKSDLKLLEYSMIGLPFVASRVAPYENSLKHGETGLFARNPKDWLKHLSRLIEDPALRAHLATGARAWAETRTSTGNVGLWEKAYGIEPR
ncbi:MAG: glycosyltransferase family 4 protein [Coriobacteriia bacterium]|nr:glycosyltransferase family 4 protein [Coriobacteriia bacterium]